MKTGQDAETAELRTFTGEKLDILTHAASDVAIQPYDFRVLFVVAQHLNRNSRVARLSDDTIADETVGSRRNVIRARLRLRKAGWLTWRSTRGANEYSLSASRFNEVSDTLIINREVRQEKRRKGLLTRRAVTPVSQERLAGVTPVSQHDVPAVSLRGVPPVSPVHLSSNTLSQTPKIPLAEITVLREGGRLVEGDEGIPAFLQRKHMAGITS
jgi:hypothetical protein